MGQIYPQAIWLQGQAVTTDHCGGSAVQGSTPQSRTYLTGVWCQLSLPLECVTCGMAGWCFNVIWSFSVGVLALRPPGRCRLRSAATCVLPRANWHELQIDLQMAATYVGLGGAQVSTKRKPRPAATSARLGPLSESYGAC